MSEQMEKTGRVTIPTDVDVVNETLELLKRWGADAVRDCDGTDYPDALRDVDARTMPGQKPIRMRYSNAIL